MTALAHAIAAIPAPTALNDHAPLERPGYEKRTIPFPSTQEPSVLVSVLAIEIQGRVLAPARLKGLLAKELPAQATAMDMAFARQFLPLAQNMVPTPLLERLGTASGRPIRIGREMRYLDAFAIGDTLAGIVRSVRLVVAFALLSAAMCPMGDDTETTNQFSRSIVITTDSTSGALSGDFWLSVNGHRTDFSADGSAMSDELCKTAIEALDNVKYATCWQGSVDGTTKGTTYVITIDEWASSGTQNNFFYHSGDPALSEFQCDASKADSAAGDVSCTIAFLDYTVTTGGSYTHTEDATFYVQVDDATVNPNTYMWRLGTTGSWNTGVAMSAGAVEMDYGTTIAFTSLYGHTLGSQWTVDCGIDKNEVLTITIDGQTTGTLIEGDEFTLSSTSTDYTIYFDSDDGGAVTAPTTNPIPVTGYNLADTAATIATRLQVAIDAIGGGGIFTATVVDEVVTVTVDATGLVADATEDTAIARLDIEVTTQGAVSGCEDAEFISTVKEHLFCGGRGLCDTSTGLCECFSGWSGPACNTQYEITDVDDASTSHLIQSTSLTYTGTVLRVEADKGPSTDFNLIWALSNGITAFKVDGEGGLYVRNNAQFDQPVNVDDVVYMDELHVHLDGITVNAGGVDVESGLLIARNGAQVTADGLSVVNVADSGSSSYFQSTSAAFTGTSLLVQAPNTAGSADFKLFETEANGQDAFVVYGGGFTEITNILDSNPTLTMTATSESFDSTALWLKNYRGYSSAYKFIECTADSDGAPPYSMFSILGDGTTALRHTATSGNSLYVYPSDPNFAGNAFKAYTARAASVAFNFIDLVANDGATNIFSIRGDGLTTIEQGGLTVVAGDVEVTAGALIVEAGGAWVTDGGLHVTAGGELVVDGGSNLNNGGALITNDADTTQALKILSSSNTFSDAVLKVAATEDPGTAFNLLELDVRENMLFTVGGSYSRGANSDLLIRIDDDSTDPQTFSWMLSIDSGGGYTGPLEMDNQAVAIGHGIEISFDATTGFTAGQIFQSDTNCLSGGVCPARAYTATNRETVELMRVRGNGAISAPVVDNTETNVKTQLQRAKWSGTAKTTLANGEVVGRLSFEGYDGTSYVPAAEVRVEVDETVVATNEMGGAIVFATTAEGAAAVTDRVVIDKAGKATFSYDVALDGSATTIGDATSDTLEVTSTILTSLRLKSTSNAYVTTIDFNALTTSDQTISIPEALTTSPALFLTTGNFPDIVDFGDIVSSSDVTTTGTITALELIETSDRRFKTDVRPISDALALVRSMNGVRFRWREGLDFGSEEEQLGFVAQDLQDVLPEVVKSGPAKGVDGDRLAVAYTKIVPVLVEAVKELELVVKQQQSLLKELQKKQ